MIDGFSEVGPDGDSSIDVSVRGAAAVASAHLRAGDRVGAVALGGMLRWLGPGTSGRQFYRIAEMLFEVRNDSVVTPDLDRIPRTALPPGALVILFSPLLDQRAIGAVTDMRERGFALVVVDVLRHEPPVLSGYPAAALTVRLWRLDRAALRTSLAGLGVPVVPWSTDDALDAAIAPLRRPRGAVDRIAVACPGWPGRSGGGVCDRRAALAAPPASAAPAWALMTRSAGACWPRGASV